MKKYTLTLLTFFLVQIAFAQLTPVKTLNVSQDKITFFKINGNTESDLVMKKYLKVKGADNLLNSMQGGTFTEMFSFVSTLTGESPLTNMAENAQCIYFSVKELHKLTYLNFNNLPNNTLVCIEVNSFDYDEDFKKVLEFIATKNVSKINEVAIYCEIGSGDFLYRYDEDNNVVALDEYVLDKANSRVGKPLQQVFPNAKLYIWEYWR